MNENANNSNLQGPADFNTEPEPNLEPQEKHNLSPFVLTIVTLVIITGGILLYIKSTIPEIVTNKEAGETTNEISDPTSNWQTYRNEEFGFEFRYPPNTKIQESEFSLMTQAIYLRQNKDIVKDEDLIFEIIISENETDWSNQPPGEGDLVRKTMLDGVETKVFYLPKGICEEPNFCSPPLTSVQFYQNGANYEMLFYNKETLSETDNQILSTFKFVEPEIDTSGWQTYRNEEFGFEIKYPENWTLNSLPTVTYFTAPPRIEVLQINTSEYKNKSLVQTAQDEISNNSCPGDRMMSQDNNGVLYVLYCSASSEVYNYIRDLDGNRYIKFSYHDNFEDNWLEEQKLKTFNQILRTFRFIE